MPRRARSDSVDAKLAVAKRSQQPIQPPAHVPLDLGDLPFFASVLDEFARSEWTAHQLELAALLARDMADAVRASVAVRAEGEVVMTPKGHLAVNPMRTAQQALKGSILSLRRSLSLNARAQESKPGRTADRRASAKQIEGALAEGDDLLN